MYRVYQADHPIKYAMHVKHTMHLIEVNTRGRQWKIKRLELNVASVVVGIAVALRQLTFNELLRLDALPDPVCCHTAATRVLLYLAAKNAVDNQLVKFTNKTTHKLHSVLHCQRTKTDSVKYG
jgi:hypothetical protein